MSSEQKQRLNFDIQELHIKRDPQTGLIAIVAINDLSRGAALGGTRCLQYPSLEEAMVDGIRLAKTMDKKLGIYKIPFSGGKVILSKPAEIADRKAYFQSLGRFIEELNGKIVTGCDVGVTTEDMKFAATQSQYITAISSGPVDLLSYFTTLGLFRASEAAIKFKLNKNSMKSMKISIQGVGKIGSTFAKMARDHGAIITICDSNEEKAKKVSEELGVKQVSLREIYQADSDIFSPCGLGNVINQDTINLINAKIICGGANNQLANADMGELLLQKDILYVPDFVANGGGSVYAAGSFLKISDKTLEEYLIKEAYDLSTTIFKRAKKENLPTNKVADNIARERINSFPNDHENSPFLTVF